MTDTPSIVHSRHRHLVSGWKAKGRSLHTVEDLLNQQTTHHGLRSPVQDHHTVAVTFVELKDHPDLMRVHSTNWKAEDEPNAIYSKEDCRAFWKTLVQAGFVPF